MSKKPGTNAGKKRHLNAIKRRQKTRTQPREELSQFGVMLKRAQFMAKQTGVKVDPIDIVDTKFVDDAKKHLASMFSYFNYLTFVDGLIRNEVIKGFKFKVELATIGRQLIGIHSRLKTIVLLDDDALYATELFELGEHLQDTAMIIMAMIESVSKYGTVIDNIILNCGSTLPPKADGTERTREEIFTEVTSTIAHDFLVRNNLIKQPEQPATAEGTV